jgi:hypothetical protein
MTRASRPAGRAFIKRDFAPQGAQQECRTRRDFGWRVQKYEYFHVFAGLRFTIDTVLRLSPCETKKP